ncbi:50S ribosomal protein L13 [Blattabacterium cuenoti]|uniref:50S ribosomal protein L13 n=1 Tax=Blattabacterium cuenoti TaxID=1653831 RepID=UPI00163CAC11|nr:50S ribosomal protein L13 [Blattabacterium cuenoti]
MDSLSFKTIYGIKSSVKEKIWVIMDASHQCLGRFSSKVASRIRGKHKPSFSPNVDCGDHVIVINSEKIKLTGKKWNYKKYIRYTGYPGGQKISSVKEVFNKDSRLLIYKAVKGMLPKNRLRHQMIQNLHIYQGSKHKHQAQKPILIKTE